MTLILKILIFIIVIFLVYVVLGFISSGFKGGVDDKVYIMKLYNKILPEENVLNTSIEGTELDFINFDDFENEDYKKNLIIIDNTVFQKFGADSADLREKFIRDRLKNVIPYNNVSLIYFNPLNKNDYTILNIRDVFKGSNGVYEANPYDFENLESIDVNNLTEFIKNTSTNFKNKITSVK